MLLPRQFGAILSIQSDSVGLFIMNLVSQLKNKNWYLNFGHFCFINELWNSPQPSGFAFGLWRTSQVVNEPTITTILVPIPITSNCISYILFAFIDVDPLDWFVNFPEYVLPYLTSICRARIHIPRYLRDLVGFIGWRHLINERLLYIMAAKATWKRRNLTEQLGGFK